MARQALAIPKDPKELAECWEEFSGWFKELCEEQRPLWELSIAEIQAEDEELYGKEEKRTKREVAQYIADKSTEDLARLDAELTSMQLRTSIIVAATTLLFAVFVLRGGSSKGIWFAIGTALLAIALLMTALSFFLAIRSLAPPFKKAWGPPYDDRVYWDLMVGSELRTYVMNSWLANSRTPIVTKYKRAHAIAVPLISWAVPLTIPGLALVFFN